MESNRTFVFNSDSENARIKYLEVIIPEVDFLHNSS